MFFTIFVTSHTAARHYLNTNTKHNNTMQNHHKLFYEAPTLDVVELKLEGVIAGSTTSGSTLQQYNSQSIFEDGEDWDE